MNKFQWFLAERPEPLLSHLFHLDEPVAQRVDRPERITDRQLRLFMAASARQGWPQLSTQKVRLAVEVGERFANDQATREECASVLQQARQSFLSSHSEFDSLALCACSVPIWDCPSWPSRRADDPGADSLRQQAHYLRDIIGTPDWKPPRVRPRQVCCCGQPLHWDSSSCGPPIDEPGEPWLTPTVIDLARAAYEQRPTLTCRCPVCKGDGGFTLVSVAAGDCGRCQGDGQITWISGELDPVRLAILADALEEAGCTQERLLEHLREESDATLSRHVRGCWAVDFCRQGARDPRRQRPAPRTARA